LVMKKGTIAVGRILTEFDGVLTGAPTYRGAMESLQIPQPIEDLPAAV
jgi:hypothetical protein